MNLSTTYLGLHIKSPLVVGASPLSDDLNACKRLEAAGAGAIVMHSLFEEQITGEKLASIYHMEMFAESYAEAMSYFPRHSDYALGPEQYLKHIGKLKKTVSIPVIASLNGITPGGWTDYARQIQDAGADGLELNIYFVGTDPQETGAEAEHRLLDVVRSVAAVVEIPLAVKLSPFYSSFANFACQLDEAGSDGIVIFNRFLQPDIDIVALDVKPHLKLSTPDELLLRLRWAAILSRQISADIAITGGVHSATDAVKSVMAGASAVQIVSALLEHGPDHLATLEADLRAWMTENGYQTIAQMRGSMSLSTCPDPQSFERANYVRTIHDFRTNHHGRL